MADWNRRVGLLAIIASALVAGCLPDIEQPTSRAPAEVARNTPPVISGSPVVAATADAIWQFQPAASDADGDELSFSATGLPAWARVDPRTGLVSGTPGEDDVGISAAIVITVSDGEESDSLPAFSVTVAAAAPSPPPPPPPPVNTRPVISGSPALAVQATSQYVFAPLASDAETPAQSLRFAILNRPSWASFSTTTGILSGTPAANQTGSYRNIVISVTDGSLTMALPAFTISVTAPPNRAPAITGTPASTASVGLTYLFVPHGSDPDGQTLSYAIANKPAWADFSTATGRLSGIPDDAHVGTAPDIVITVRDSAGASASLPAFSITVAAPDRTGSAALSWVPPTQYNDGSALPASELGAYRIYYGATSTTLSRLAEVDELTTSFTAQDLGSGTHYFAVTAVSSTGVESELSTVDSKTIP